MEKTMEKAQGEISSFPWRLNKGRGCYEIRNGLGRLIVETLDASRDSMIDARFIVHSVNSRHALAGAMEKAESL